MREMKHLKTHTQKQITLSSVASLKMKIQQKLKWEGCRVVKEMRIGQLSD